MFAMSNGSVIEGKSGGNCVVMDIKTERISFISVNRDLHIPHDSTIYHCLSEPVTERLMDSIQI